MRIQIRKPEPAPTPQQFKTQNTENPSVAGVLQAFRQGIVQRESFDEEDESLQMKSAPSLQAKSESSQAVGQVLQRFKNGIIQRESFDDEEELLQGKFSTIQREEWDEEEEPLQGKWNVAQRESLDEEEDILQGKFTHRNSSINGESESPLQKKENRTGLPDNLKSGVENLSGFSMDDVRVHYNSPKPAQLQALAYTQGTDIHVGPGQEKHLPHEAWHVVQQMQGRVQPTMQMQGVNVNDNEELEKEADVMGAEVVIANAFAGESMQMKVDKEVLQRIKDSEKKSINLKTHSVAKRIIAVNYGNFRYHADKTSKYYKSDQYYQEAARIIYEKLTTEFSDDYDDYDEDIDTIAEIIRGIEDSLNIPDSGGDAKHPEFSVGGNKYHVTFGESKGGMHITEEFPDKGIPGKNRYFFKVEHKGAQAKIVDEHPGQESMSTKGGLYTVYSKLSPDVRIIFETNYRLLTGLSYNLTDFSF